MKINTNSTSYIYLFFFFIVTFYGFSQERKQGTLNWEYDIPDTKLTQFERVHVSLKYELYLEKIAENKYKVWAKYTFTPFGTKIWPERGGAYNYKYNGKWYNSDEMWRVDPRTEDGFMNTYGFIPDIKVTMVSMSGYIIGNTETLFFTVVSDNYSVNATSLGYISDPSELNSISITPENTKVNYITVDGTQKLHQRINSYEKKLNQDKILSDLVSKADREFNNRNYSSAKSLYEQALNINPNSSQIQNKLNQINKEIENQKSQKENEQKKIANNQNSTNPQDKSQGNINTTNATQKNKNNGIEEARRVSEENNRIQKEKLDNYFSETREKLKKESENKMKVISQSYYANNARRNAEEGLESNSRFYQEFDNIDELMDSYYSQINNINESASDLLDARIEQNKNNLEYYWGTSTGTDRAIGEVATGIANIIAQSQAEKERKAAVAKLEKEKNEQLKKIEEEKKRIEEERKRKILELRTEIFNRFTDGGLPKSKDNIDQNELYFYTYHNINNQVYISNVFPYSSYNDGSWPYKNKVIEESEKITNARVNLIGYFTSKIEAENHRQSFLNILPQIEISVNHYNVNGKKAKSEIINSDSFWEKPSETKNKIENFWDTPSENKKRSENFWK